MHDTAYAACNAAARVCRYGFVVPDGDAEQQHHDSSDDEAEDEADAAQTEAGAAAQGDAVQAADGDMRDKDGERVAAADDDAAAMEAASRDAAAAQPTGFTLDTTQVIDCHVARPTCLLPKLLLPSVPHFFEFCWDWLEHMRLRIIAQPVVRTLYMHMHSHSVCTVVPSHAALQVKTPVPFLLKHKLREYQHIGLDWLVSLYEKRINGILAGVHL